MQRIDNKERIAVADLRKGLYVAEPDRPWTEIPLMFQGFEIRDDAEIAVLRQHCEFVYVDAERSQSAALAAARSDPAPGPDPESVPTPETPSAQPAERARQRAENRWQADVSAVLGDARHPHKEPFTQRVQEAAGSHTQAREFVESALRDVRLGRSVDTRDARELIGDLIGTVSENASAALWLANLRNKDEYTSMHSVNVCILAVAFAMHLGTERERLERIGMGALLHDVGKTRMPTDILEKPGPLTDEEFEIARRHPQDGYEIVADSGDVPEQALEIVRLHHERRGGQGYPLGLKDGEIPAHVRVVGLVNRYESLTSERPYRAATPADQVLQELYNGAMTEFGRRPVEHFIRCVGIYPVGSLVELDNGALGVVVGSPPNARLQPTVLLVRTPDGEFYEKRLLLNLAADAGDAATPARQVRRVVNPALVDIDVAAIVAFEFGFELGSGD